MATVQQVQRRSRANDLRATDRQVIQEQLADLVVVEVEGEPVNDSLPVMRWVVEAFLCDGDKWWLDSYEVVFISEDFESANACCVEWDLKDHTTTDGRPAPKTRLEYRDVSTCEDCQYHLKYRVQPSGD